MVETVTYTSYLNDHMSSGLKKMAGNGKAAISTLNDSLGKTSGLLKGMGGQLAAAFSVYAVINVAKQSLQAWDEQMKADAQIKSALISTNYAAGLSFQHLSDQASDFQKKTLFTDDQVAGAQALLLASKAVKGEIFDKTMPAVLDMAQALKMDLSSAARIAGKALFNPIEGVQLLGRSNIKFTEAQKEQIKVLQESGDIAGAQSLIIDNLTTSFGNSAEAAAKAGLGPLLVFQNRMAEIKESIGGVIGSVLLKLLPAFRGFASALEGTMSWMREHKQTIVSVIQSVIGLTAAWAAYKIGAQIHVAIDVIKYTWMMRHVIATTLQAKATNFLTIAQKGLNAAIKANPIGFILAGVVALVSAITWVWNKFEGFRMFLYGLWESFKAVFTNIKDLALNVLGGIGEMIVGIMGGKWDIIKSGFERLKGGFKEYKAAVYTAFIDGAIAGSKAFKEDQAKNNTVTNYGGTGAVNPDDYSGGGTDDSPGLGTGLSVTGDGKSVKNITISITNLVNEINNNFTTVQESSKNITEQIKQALLTAVNDANLIGG